MTPNIAGEGKINRNMYIYVCNVIFYLKGKGLYLLVCIIYILAGLAFTSTIIEIVRYFFN